MKKILALVLAATMLSVSAFAGTFDLKGNPMENTTDEILPPVENAINLSGHKIQINMNEFMNTKANQAPTLGASGVPNYEFNKDNFTVSYQASKGKELIEKVTFDEKGNLVIEFKKGPTVAKLNTRKPDFVLKSLSVKTKRPIKDAIGTILVKPNVTYALENIVNTVLGTENTHYVIVQDIQGTKKIDELSDLGELDNTKIVKGEDSTVMKAELSYSDNEITAEGRVYVNNVVTFKSDKDLNKAVEALYMANPDANIDWNNLTVKGFTAPLTVKLTVADKGDVLAKDQKIYALSSDGKLTPAKLKWNADEEVWEGKVSATTTFVSSDVALKAAPVSDAKPGEGENKEENKVTIPETGLVLDFTASIVK